MNETNQNPKTRPGRRAIAAVLLAGFEFREFTDALALAPGNYSIQIGVADPVNPGSQPALIDVTVPLVADENATILAERARPRSEVDQAYLDGLVEEAQEALNNHLREIIDWHFSPETGCPFWLDWAKEAGWDPRQEIQSMDDSCSRIVLLQAAYQAIFIQRVTSWNTQQEVGLADQQQVLVLVQDAYFLLTVRH